jgi:hypothetical protein
MVKDNTDWVLGKTNRDVGELFGSFNHAKTNLLPNE